MSQNDEELVVLVDDTGQAIGSMEKSLVHSRTTPLHLAFSCYVFNDSGELLVTKRAISKKVWPGVWSNSLCGHPAPGEPMEAAIKRRAFEELGIKQLVHLAPMNTDYRYKTPVFEGIIENEICPIYRATTDDTIKPNPDEVGEFRWMSVAAYRNDIQKRAEEYSYWAKDQLRVISLR